MIFHICHHCITYRTIYKKDMIKHFSRRNKCHANTIISYDEAFQLSVNKKFIFEGVLASNLNIGDFIYIINNYTDEKNIIDKDFRKKNSLLLTNEKSEHNEQQKLNKKIKKKDEFYYDYYDEAKDKYVCDKCCAEYTTKQNLQYHLINIKACEEKQKNNLIREKKLKELEIKKAIQAAQNQQTTYVNNIEQLNNIGNLNNIQNIQNNNNNVQHTNYNISVKDFIHDRYDVGHIQDSFYQNKDFFLFTNFLRVIMENKKNQNIFFTDNHQEAIVYTGNELNRISSDKAGYLILDKLSQSFDQILYKQDDEAQEYYKFIQKYYSVLKGQYKHDTIYKDYDVDEQKFIYTANSSLFRSRDKNLQKMISTLDNCNSEARENMKYVMSDIRKIPLVNPNIEDFASIRNRYKDLKD
jgi:hypothetical protein